MIILAFGVSLFKMITIMRQNALSLNIPKYWDTKAVFAITRAFYKHYNNFQVYLDRDYLLASTVI